MVLYHAISSYQILESFIHRNLNHKEEKAILILPDFVVNKFPHYEEIVELDLFDEVFLFPYRRIPHKQETLYDNVSMHYEKIIKYDIHSYDEIYVAAAHFYFSTYLIENEVEFNYFEDGCGILTRPEISFDLVNGHTPFQANWAEENGMFEGKHSLVRNRICNVSAQTKPITGLPVIDFNVATELANIDKFVLQNVLKFFDVPKKINILENSILIMTQQLSNLKKITFEEQILLYQLTVDYYASNYNLLFKPHPDDVTFYNKLFPGATIIKGKFPSELIPFISNDIKIEAALVQYSSALDGVKKCFETNIFCGYGIEAVYKQIHRYYYAFKIAESINLNNDYNIYAVNLFEDQIKNLLNYSSLNTSDINVNFVDDLKTLDSLNESDAKKIYICGDLSEKEIIEEKTISILFDKCKDDDIIIFINDENKYMFYDIDRAQIFNDIVPIAIKKKQLKEEVYCDLEDEFIYIYTKGEDKKMDIEKINISQNHTYTGIETSVKGLDERSIEMALLKAKLEATAQRLRYYIELANNSNEK